MPTLGVVLTETLLWMCPYYVNIQVTSDNPWLD